MVRLRGSFSEQAKGGEAGEGAAAKAYAENDAGEDIAEEMQAEDDPGKGDAGGEEEERQLERRIEIAEHERYGKCGHGVAGREGKTVGRKNLRPAVRFELAGARTMLEPGKLDEFKKNVAKLENRAVFEIPEILSRLMENQLRAESREKEAVRASR